jgi:chlorite dismutase
MTDDARIQPPETIEGLYSLHQVFGVLRGELRELGAQRAEAVGSFQRALEGIAAPREGEGWSAVVPLAGSTADVMFVHFRDSIESLQQIRNTLAQERLFEVLEPQHAHLGITEIGLYHVTAKLSREAAERGGKAGDDAYVARLAHSVAEERENPKTRRRLFPEQPAGMPYVCFYPMSKRRDPDANWYALTLDERSALMYGHSVTARRYAGRVQQIITGSIGLDAWEWGVTLFAPDPLVFKKLVTETRFDEVSARYAQFGEFFVGKTAKPAEWLATL